MSRDLTELSILEAVMNDDEERAEQLVEDGMTPSERAILAMNCSTVIRICMGTNRTLIEELTDATDK